MQYVRVLRGLRALRPDPEFRYLRLDLLHADRLPRLPRDHGYDHAADPVAALASSHGIFTAEITLDSRRPAGTGTSSTWSGWACSCSSISCRRLRGSAWERTSPVPGIRLGRSKRVKDIRPARHAVPRAPGAQLPSADAVDDDHHQRERQRHARQRIDQAPLATFSLVDHQEVEAGAEAGQQGQQQHDDEKFEEHGVVSGGTTQYSESRMCRTQQHNRRRARHRMAHRCSPRCSCAPVLSLGFWQLTGRDEKRHRRALAAQRDPGAGAIEPALTTRDPPVLAYRRVLLEGEFVPGSQFPARQQIARGARRLSR